ncbi:Trp biosynthesis-associated membrane protein [Kitasatospora sp. NPDC001574]
MIVVDASALVLALADEGERGAAARAELAADDEWAAPEHLVIEVMQSLRGLYLARELTAERVGELATELPGLAIRKVPVGPLLGRIWELKDNLTPDDAAYVAVAEQYGVPLVTADLRLMRASGPRCEIRGIGRPGGHTGWPWVALAGGLLLALAGLLTLRFGRGWPAMGSRYEAPTGKAPVSRKSAAAESPADLWKALDRGEDPTAG